MGADDCSILAATAAAIGLTVVACMGVHYGIGKHSWDIPPLNLVEIVKLAYISQLIYTVSLGFTKASLSLLLVRISTTNRTIKLTWTIFGITTAATVSTLIASIFQCTPIHYRWERMNPMSNLKGTCLQFDLLQYSTQGINIVTDLVLWLLPLRLITQVKLPRRQKWGLYIVFLLGFLVPIASVSKLIVITKIVVSPDPAVSDLSYTGGVQISAWSVVEVNIAIICCSMPTIRPLLKKLIPGLLGTVKSVPEIKKDRTSGYQNRGARAKGGPMPLGSVEGVSKPVEGTGSVGVVTMTRREVGESYYDNHSVDFPVPGSSHDEEMSDNTAIKQRLDEVLGSV